MKNNKGFTLVELLAVIVIMGILMMVAIPSVTRTIENSRKDTFVDIAKSYGNAARTLWTSDNLTCNGVVSSAVDDGDYYILINSKSGAKDSLPVLVDQGGKSSWGNRDVNGYVRVNISTTPGVDNNGDGVLDVEPKRLTKFYVALSDGTHGILDNDTVMMDELVRGNVNMKLSEVDLKKIEFTLDDGRLNCSKDANGVYSCTNVTPIRNMTGVCVDDNTNVSTVPPSEPPIESPIYFGNSYNALMLETVPREEWVVWGYTFYEDGHVDITVNGQSGLQLPAGSITYSDGKIYQNGTHTHNISADKKTITAIDGSGTMKLDDPSVNDAYFGQKYSAMVNSGGTTSKYTYIAYENGSGKFYINDVLQQQWPTGTFKFCNVAAFMNDKVAGIISDDRKELKFIAEVTGLDVTIKLEE